MPCIEIAGRRIGAGRPAYVVAEVSDNDNQTKHAALCNEWTYYEAVTVAGGNICAY